MVRNPSQKGFTLLEVMVVLLIIGILLGMATLSIGHHGARRKIQEERTALRQKMVLAADEAVINQQEIGVRFFSGGYVFLLQDEKNRWRSPAQDRFFQPYAWPVHSIVLSLQVEGEKVTVPDAPLGLPQLFFLSSGEQTPFQIELQDGSAGERFPLTGDWNGVLPVIGRPL